MVGKYHHCPNFGDTKAFKWEMGNIDVEWKDRCSPVNELGCGVKENGRMMNLSEFEREWDLRLKSSQARLEDFYLKKNSKDSKQATLAQLALHLKNTKIFDIICYRTFAKIIYETDKVEDWDVPAQKWLSEREKDFEKSYLDRNKKC